MNDIIEPQNIPKETSSKMGDISAMVLGNLQKLSFDHQVIFFCQILTGLFCFFPWISLAPFYGMWLHRNAFQGETWLMGIILFLLCCAVTLFFVMKITDRSEFKLPISEAIFFRFVTFLGLLTLIFAWSVLTEVQGGYEDAQMKFGLGGAFVSQILSCVGAWQLRPKIKKQPDFVRHSLKSDHLFHHEE